MDNPLLPKIPITLDKDRTLCYSTYSLWQLEKATGLNALDGSIFGLFKNISAGNLSLLTWAGLIHEDKTLTAEQVSEMIPVSGMDSVLEKVAAAWKASMPEQKQGEAAVSSDPQAGAPTA